MNDDQKQEQGNLKDYFSVIQNVDDYLNYEMYYVMNINDYINVNYDDVNETKNDVQFLVNIIQMEKDYYMNVRMMY